jgi:hypothetical protein
MQVFGDIPMRSGKPLDHLVLCGAAFTQRRAARPNVGFGPKTVVTPSKWDVCIAPRKQTSVSYAVDCDLIVCYGGAKLTHKHLASKIHCVEIIAPLWIETSLRDLMENLCALNGRSLPRQSQFI